MEHVRIFFFYAVCALRALSPVPYNGSCSCAGWRLEGIIHPYKRHATMQLWSCGEGSTRDKREEQTNNARHGTPGERLLLHTEPPR